MAQESENITSAHVFVNEEDGLPDIHPDRMDTQTDQEVSDSDDHFVDDLPTSLIVTNIHNSVFGSDELRSNMENLFRSFSNEVSFQWLKSFRRLRVSFASPMAAANARLQLHRYTLDISTISCYFVHSVKPVGSMMLHPPAPVKQFLISPPPSPPVGWEPRPEMEPLISEDLLGALAGLSPGESQELCSPADNHPSIVLYTAFADLTDHVTDLEGLAAETSADHQSKIPHTRCPGYN